MRGRRVPALEQRCYRVLALQAPVASDLRQVVAAMRIIAEVERSADLAVNVCKAARRMYGHALRRASVASSAGWASRRPGCSARRTRRTSSATPPGRSAIADMDDLLDGLQRQFVTAIFAAPDTIDLPTAVQLAVLARFYERIGDHAVTIGERVQYLVTGQITGRLRSTGSANSSRRSAGIGGRWAMASSSCPLHTSLS